MIVTDATNRYAEKFSTLQTLGQKGFIPFTLLGWPNFEQSKVIIRQLVEANPAALELGLPFSDPVADGSTIQQAVSETLATGFKIPQAFELIAYARTLNTDMPIGLLVYYNTVLAQGLEGFFTQAKQAGVDAVLIADLPPEMAEEVKPVADAVGIALVFIVSPLTKPERLTQLAKVAGAFFYVVSRLGITGSQAVYDENLPTLMTMLREKSTLPLYVGFGISTPEQAQTMINLGADGYITGSKIIELVREKADLPAYLKAMVQIGQQADTNA
jgi:tryptophan synthase alpha chain